MDSMYIKVNEIRKYIKENCNLKYRLIVYDVDEDEIYKYRCQFIFRKNQIFNFEAKEVLESNTKEFCDKLISSVK